MYLDNWPLLLSTIKLPAGFCPLLACISAAVVGEDAELHLPGLQGQGLGLPQERGDWRGQPGCE